MRKTFIFAVLCLFFVKNVNGNFFYDAFKIKTISNPSSDQGSSKVKTKEFSQNIDHGNIWRGIWKQRYYENLEFFEYNGPIYVFIGGELPDQTYFLSEGLTYDLAKETGGALFMIEHRYYEGNLPFDLNGDDYLNNLKYLTSTQAINDIAYFIQHVINHKYPNRKIVLVGGSYPGNLAVWTKQLYPDLAHAAIASSAPLLSKLDFHEYQESISKTLLKYGGNECYDYIKNMFKRYDGLLQTDAGRNIIQKDEKMCSGTDLTKRVNQQLFMVEANSYFRDLVQYADNVEAIQEACDDIVSKHKKMADINPDLLDPSGCDFESAMQGLAENRTDTAFLWFYQVCMEFGNLQATHSDKQAFGSLVTTDFYFNICKTLFGDVFDSNRLKSAISDLNLRHRGLNPTVKNVVFTNGGLDPWHKLGITKNLSALAPAVFSPVASHGIHLLPATDKDPEDVINERKVVKNLIKKWIGQA